MVTEVTVMVTVMVAIMVAVVMMPVVYVDIEVGQYKESRIPETPSPKRIRYPAVEVSIVGRWCVIGYYWGPFVVVVITHCP